MNNHGIISQAGFEYQKLIFIYEALRLTYTTQITYEGKDDVEISDNYFPISSLQTTNSDSLVQVKSGLVSAEVLDKIFFNWLLNYEDNKRFICYLENPITIDYKSQDFKNDLILRIVNIPSKTRRDALVKKVNTKYGPNKSKLEVELEDIIRKSEFIIKPLKDLQREAFNSFSEIYSDDGSSDVTKKERFLELSRRIVYELSEKLLNKCSYTLKYSTFMNMISDIKQRISAEAYEIDYTQFKSRSLGKVDKVLSDKSRAVRQLRIVNNNNAFVIEGLTQKLFYEDLQEYYKQVHKSSDINALECLAHSNFEDVKLELSDHEVSPLKLYMETIKKELESPLFLQNSSQRKFYSKGCYIHLTDDDVSEELLISWGEENE